MKCRKAIGLQNSKTYLHAAFAPEGNRISKKTTTFYSIFSVLFIAVGLQYSKTYFAQRLRKKETEFLLQSKIVYKTYVNAAFAHEENRISIKENNIL